MALISEPLAIARTPLPNCRHSQFMRCWSPKLNKILFGLKREGISILELGQHPAKHSPRGNDLEFGKAFIFLCIGKIETSAYLQSRSVRFFQRWSLEGMRICFDLG